VFSSDFHRVPIESMMLVEARVFHKVQFWQQRRRKSRAESEAPWQRDGFNKADLK
jgi:hypothetical protein